MQTYTDSQSLKQIQEQVKTIIAAKIKDYTNEDLKKIFGLIDLTSLNSTDTDEKIIGMCNKVNDIHKYYPALPNVAAICVYPAFVSLVDENRDNKEMQIASVTAGFPASQTFLSVKVAESKLALEKGADEIDIVISIGKFLSGDYDFVAKEISVIKQAAGDAHVKVILETGALTMEQVKRASVLAIESGADFIKTSTGKLEPAASLEAVFVMTQVIAEYYKKTNKKIGIKPAGGISTAEEALKYMAIIEHNLGKQWITPKLFRIGASSLANNLINSIYGKNELEDIKYF